jgi:hypothetical protein
VSERPDSSSLQARVCDPMVEKLWGPSGSVLWYLDLIRLRVASGASPIQSHKADPTINDKKQRSSFRTWPDRHLIGLFS